jgi:hypothetical protein
MVCRERQQEPAAVPGSEQREHGGRQRGHDAAPPRHRLRATPPRLQKRRRSLWTHEGG